MTGAVTNIIENADLIKEFDMDLFVRIIEKMTVFEAQKIIVTLLDATEGEVVIIAGIFRNNVES